VRGAAASLGVKTKENDGKMMGKSAEIHMAVSQNPWNPLLVTSK
jgi:hypothetical protein